MRYTIDPLEPSDDGDPDPGPLVEVLGPDSTWTPLRDNAGRVKGGVIGTDVGRAKLGLLGTPPLPESFELLREAIAELALELDTLEISIGGDDPGDPDTEPARLGCARRRVRSAAG